ncbi:cyclase [Strigomonas culicis]|uniref:Cyclase n=1 Tax=Strigomonas culicis TaxID=28005 RepID=S9UYT4_9TRYP|nr:cyclase [Strigomonas culicis]EPY33899.1 cyclase [Strigomonas culicis]|eukprot:EPY33408.1 cyclase [Strigomonas culicis]
MIDLSLPLEDGMPVYEGDPKVRISKVCTRETDGWEVRELALGSHTGTHVDAPVHMHEGGATLDEIPLSRFCGPAVVVASGDDAFPERIGLLFDETVPASVVPKIVTALPLFVGGDLEEETERALLAQGIITYTDLVNVGQLKGKQFTFYGFPLRIKNGDGSPVRAVAILAE